MNRQPTQGLNKSCSKKTNITTFLSSQFIYTFVEVLLLWAGRKKAQGVEQSQTQVWPTQCGWNLMLESNLGREKEKQVHLLEFRLRRDGNRVKG